MTDRYKGATVTFERDIREDDAESLLAAIRQLRGVAAVRPLVAATTDLMARDRVRHETRVAILDAIHKILD